MFDYERGKGKYFKDKRCTSYEWTETGIKLTIAHIDKGKYEGSVSKGGREHNDTVLELNEIFGMLFIFLVNH